MESHPTTEPDESGSPIEPVTRCGACGSVIYRDDRFCACCGGELPRHCRSCGAGIRYAMANYCSRCGAPAGSGRAAGTGTIGSRRSL